MLVHVTLAVMLKVKVKGKFGFVGLHYLFLHTTAEQNDFHRIVDSLKTSSQS